MNADQATAPRCGIATAVVVGDRWYLIDAGHGTFTQIKRAGLDISDLAGIFITHLHSDHIIDLNSVTIFGMFDLAGQLPEIPIYGPGDRQVLPQISPRAQVPVEPIFPGNPTPGIAGLFTALMQAHATDLNDRIIDALRPSPLDVWQPRNIVIPPEVGFHANDNPFPDVAPWVIHEDDRVRVSATLVVHPPIAPAFAFRFDTEAGSVTISGDTRPSDNLVTLAENTDLLLHEAIDFDWVHAAYPGRNEMERASVDHHRKSHTSPTEAGEIATRANARRLALHHVVPGNTPRAVLETAGTTFDGGVLVPDDLDDIALSVLGVH
ncbi:metallo-beta-lactamase [Corynebacterium halotolerans YIM 70093 = DSM 44683]|uniref:Metallo-beta-lactamase n=1 Tax=Corynebacterium halotolerans YIM 70093 = DSM 44683 TaxID=1121362 RepID=M1P1R4_9CORY|nr:metallo-beta-lactamase [Corynebacterium halotolerans YIM 70093 = DSM 44683]